MGPTSCTDPDGEAIRAWIMHPSLQHSGWLSIVYRRCFDADGHSSPCRHKSVAVGKWEMPSVLYGGDICLPPYIESKAGGSIQRMNLRGSAAGHCRTRVPTATHEGPPTRRALPHFVMACYRSLSQPTPATLASTQGAIKNCFIRGSVVRYIQIPSADVDTELLQDACRKESAQGK